MRRLLPRGPADLLWQALIIVGAYFAWRYARGAVDGSTEAALANARDLVAAERWLHSYIELDVQQWAVATGWAADAAAYLYGHAHFWVTLGAFVFIYFAHRGSFGFFRNALIAAMAISLLGYWLVPTAPPRFVPELGFSASAAIQGTEPVQVSSDPFFNPYAAVPSMHVGFAVIVAFSLARLTRPLALRVLFAAYPLLMTYVVVATGNHFWLDAAFGAAAAAAALSIATMLGRLRPERWALQPASPRPAPPPAGEAEAVPA